MKHIRKWLPVPTYDLPGMEGWLEEMAGRGLYLERLNSWTARFRRGEPRSRRFRLQPCCSCEREFSRQEDLVALFAGFGWQCEGWASSPWPSSLPGASGSAPAAAGGRSPPAQVRSLLPLADHPPPDAPAADPGGLAVESMALFCRL